MMEILFPICIGVGLAAACGFRVFVPMLVVSAASHAQWLELSEEFAWVGGWPALLTFSVATVIEIVAYYVPWLDNLLDTISIPTATVAGIVTSASVMSMGEFDPLLTWTLAIIAGGGSAGAISAGTSAVRATSTMLTGGLGNPIVSTLEWIAALVLSVLSVVVPLLAVAAVIALLFVAWRLVLRWFGSRRQSTRQASEPSPTE